MVSAPTIVLHKIFVKGFYRVHSGLLLFSFVTIITYGFFINVLEENHIPPDQLLRHHLALVLALLSSPLMVALVFAAWLFLTVKAWGYVAAQLVLPVNQFLMYSTTSLSKWRQFRSWFIVHFLISAPVITYGLFALLIGLIFGYYLMPVIIIFYAIFLSVISALVYVMLGNRSKERVVKSVVAMAAPLGKPFYSLFIYAILDRMKMAFAFTKIGSVAVILCGINMFPEPEDNFKTAGILSLGIAVAHIILIFQSHQFEKRYLIFSRNFPVALNKLYLKEVIVWFLLLLPENAWFTTRFGGTKGVLAVLLNLTLVLLFRAMLYRIAPAMKAFLYQVFFLFASFFIVILFNGEVAVVVLAGGCSWFFFRRDYYRMTV